MFKNNQAYKTIEKSGLFDPFYYLINNPDVLRADIDPLQHFIEFGWKEGRNPSSLFHTNYYLEMNPDVRESGLNPLFHFINYGWKEGRNPSSSFHTNYYLEMNPDVKESGLNPLFHFINYGWKEGRNPSPEFYTNFYLKVNPEKWMSGINPLVHYLKYGKNEGRQTNLLRNQIEQMEINKNKSIDEYQKLTFPIWDKPQVSIIIPVYNQFDYTYYCLKSILDNTNSVTYEVLLANDCSSDLTTQIEEIIEGITVINNSVNLRFLKNCNSAAKLVKGEFIVFLNNDTYILSNWLLELVKAMEDHPDCGLCGSKIIYPNNCLQEAGGIIWNDASGCNYGRMQDPDASEYNYFKEVDYISGCSIMIRTSLWNQISGFDDRFAPAYYEDSDLAFEVRALGYKVFYQPLSVIIHFEGISHGKEITSGQKQYQVTNQKKFYEKWKSVLETEHFSPGENSFLARDRSKNRKTILIIDHYVPTYDQDAGSRTIYQYISLLVQIGYNVKFIPDNFIRSERYTEALQQMGVEVLYGPLYAANWQSWIQTHKNFIDIVFINRPHIANKYLEFCKDNTNAKIVYNVCDLHFLRERRMYEITHDKNLLKTSKKWYEIETRMINKADIVFTLSIDEKEIINKLASTQKGIIAPIFIYENISEPIEDFSSRQDLLFVGGFAHKPNLDGVLWFLNEVFPIIENKDSVIRIHIVGSHTPEEISSLASDRIIIHGFVNDDQLEKLYRKCRIVVIPLRFGAGVKGKTIEAMYYGLPIVSTTIGIEGLERINEIITPHDSAISFANGILELYWNENRLRKMSKEDHNFVKSHFSKESVTSFFKNIF